MTAPEISDTDRLDPFATSNAPPPRGRALWLWLLAAFALNLALSLWLAGQAGAFSADLFGHPDEAAHYVTGLVVHDYVFHGGIPGHPLRFTEDFYEFYPKVALGHYPPGFYAVEAVWMLLRGTHWSGMIELLALFSAALAVLVFYLTTRLTNPVFGLITSLFFTCIPLQQRYVSLVMSDHLLSLLILLSALAFGIYAESSRARHALLFALLAAAAILTKASGIMLALVPPLVIIATGHWALLRRPGFWISGVLVGLLTAPWFFLTAGITEEGMMEYSPAYHLQAFAYYLGKLVDNFGYGFLFFAVAGFIFTPQHLLHNFGRVPGPWVAFLGMPLLVLVLYVVLPTGLDDRYWLPAIPTLVFCAAAGVHFLARLLANRMAGEIQPADTLPGRYYLVAPLLGVLLIFLTATAVWRIPPKDLHGYSQAVAAMSKAGFLPLDEDTATNPALAREDQPIRVLIASDAPGEGAFVAAVAWRDHTRRRVQVVRATKALAEIDWLGANIENVPATPEDIKSTLADLDLDLVALDQSVPPKHRLPYHDLLAETLPEVSTTWPKAQPAPAERLAPDEPVDALPHPIQRRTDIRGLTLSPSPYVFFYNLRPAEEENSKSQIPNPKQ